MTWWWVNGDRFFVFGLTILLSKNYKWINPFLNWQIKDFKEFNVRVLLYVQYPEQPVCTSLLFTLLFIKSQYTVFFLHILLFFAHLIVLHFLFHCTFYSYFSFFTIYMLLCCVTLYNFYFYYFALSPERTWFHLHFTSDYTLYNLLCDK